MSRNKAPNTLYQCPKCGSFSQWPGKCNDCRRPTPFGALGRKVSGDGKVADEKRR